ncbi:MAG: PIN domain-containing protein [Oscillospiraceae bacterium]|nr:PIN domain-containing protein [Oscillospiraceae bacterium]
MKILDANMIIRLFVYDNSESAFETIRLIDNYPVLLLPEVAAEIVFVMTKFYKLDRKAVASALLELLTLENVKTNCGNVLKSGIQFYQETSLDFVDCLLCAYHTEENYEICTFDKKLQKLIARQDEK